MKLPLSPLHIATTLALPLLLAGAARAGTGTNATAVVDYAPGNASLSYQNTAAALGAINGVTSATYGGLTPFNPAYQNSQIMIVGAGGQLTLQLGGEVPADGYTLGVFSNNGIQDTSADASGLAGNPVATFSAPSQAVVSVSQDGTHFVQLNNGNPLTFDNPANYYTDQPISGGVQQPGTLHADPYRPYLGNLQSFAGLPYTAAAPAASIVNKLDGSAGGTWVNLAGSGLPAVNFVRFNVPTGHRLVLDSVSGMTAAAAIVPGSPIISESVGTGANTSNVVVDFGPQSFDFQVHYDAAINGVQALGLIQQNADFQFTVEHFSFGDLVNGIDYGGYKQTGDGSTPPNYADYWAYYTSADGTSWASSNVGASDRVLSNGSWDGWSWNPLRPGAPDVPLAAVPEPASLGLLAIGAMSLLSARRRK